MFSTSSQQSCCKSPKGPLALTFILFLFSPPSKYIYICIYCHYKYQQRKLDLFLGWKTTTTSRYTSIVCVVWDNISPMHSNKKKALSCPPLTLYKSPSSITIKNESSSLIQPPHNRKHCVRQVFFTYMHINVVK